MNYAQTDIPAVYLVAWDQDLIVKAGYSGRQRWRAFELRGARVVAVAFRSTVAESFRLETQLARILDALPAAFDSPLDAVPHLGNSGAGYLECRRAPDADQLNAALDACAEAMRPGNAAQHA